jgi:vacuolar protein sorting-associated protein 53
MIILFREDIARLLENAGSSLTVTTLMQSLQQALEFENFVSKKYSMPVRLVLRAQKIDSTYSAAI